MFETTKAVADFAKTGTELSKVVAATLQNDRKEGFGLLQQETLKAALAACLWNNPLRLLQLLESTKNGKKTKPVRFWIEVTTKLMRELPANKAGDVSRINNPDIFIRDVNEAVASYERDWTSFVADYFKPRAAKATSATSATSATDTSATSATAELEALKAENENFKAANAALKAENENLKAALAAMTAQQSVPKRAKKVTA